MRLFKQFAVVLLGVGILASCSKPTVDSSGLFANTDDPGKAVMKVGDLIITDTVFEVLMRIRNDQADTEETLREELIKTLVLASEAQKKGLETVDMKILLELQHINQLRIALTQQFNQQLTISEKDIRARYDAAKEVSGSTQYRLSHILSGSEGEAQNVLNNLEQGEAFPLLAKRYSLHQSKEQGGGLGWVEKGQLPPEVAAILDELSVGSYRKESVKSNFGWHVVFLHEKRPLSIPEFADVKEGIKRSIAAEALDEHVTKLVESASIQMEN